MENCGNFFWSGNRGQDCNNANTTGGWDIWEVSASRLNWTTTSNPYNSADAAAAEETGDCSTFKGASPAQALMYQQQQNYSLYAENGSYLNPDPHLVCLNLGKRSYCEDATVVERHVIDFASVGKRVKADSNNSGTGHVGSSTRCQVEGCHVALVNAKDYHKRHKVCELHSKAPSVIVQGSEQRFCQQCSRFHMVTEFDEAKRSCRRRLAGHNERRRKTPNVSLTRSSSQDEYISGGRFSYLTSSQTAGRACSLLSSSKSHFDSWDLSSRSSAALRELILENRTAMLAQQIIFNHSSNPSMEQDFSHSLLQSHQQQYQFLPAEPYRHVTLDLMQTPTSAFGIFARAKQGGVEQDKEGERGTCGFENFQQFAF